MFEAVRSTTAMYIGPWQEWKIARFMADMRGLLPSKGQPQSAGEFALQYDALAQQFGHDSAEAYAKVLPGSYPNRIVHCDDRCALDLFMYVCTFWDVQSNAPPLRVGSTVPAKRVSRCRRSWLGTQVCSQLRIIAYSHRPIL